MHSQQILIYTTELRTYSEEPQNLVLSSAFDCVVQDGED